MRYQFTRWVIIAVFGIALELLIFAVIARIFFEVQRGWSGKAKGLVVFALRLPSVINTPLRPLVDRCSIRATRQLLTGVLAASLSSRYTGF